MLFADVRGILDREYQSDTFIFTLGDVPVLALHGNVSSSLMAQVCSTGLRELPFAYNLNIKGETKIVAHVNLDQDKHTRSMDIFKQALYFTRFPACVPNTPNLAQPTYKVQGLSIFQLTPLDCIETSTGILLTVYGIIQPPFTPVKLRQLIYKRMLLMTAKTMMPQDRMLKALGDTASLVFKRNEVQPLVVQRASHITHTALHYGTGYLLSDLLISIGTILLAWGRNYTLPLTTLRELLTYARDEDVAELCTGYIKHQFNRGKSGMRDASTNIDTQPLFNKDIRVWEKTLGHIIVHKGTLTPTLDAEALEYNFSLGSIHLVLSGDIRRRFRGI